MSSKTQRERFEAWHARQYISTDPLEWDGDGYVDFDHNRAWKAWQAAEAAALERAAQECEEREIAYMNAYKNSPIDDMNRGNPYMEGMADGAGNCADAIRALAAPAEREGDNS
ncbi:hypothetical protein [Paraburkholderia sp. 2C]